MNRSRVKKVILILAGLLVVMQLVQPKRTNPPIDESKTLGAHVHIPPQVDSILDRSCGDCHSDRTVWPWYAHVAPFSWVVVDDVNQGRRHVNFSDWTAQRSPKLASYHLGLICKESQDGSMPPLSYRLIHKNSRLSSDDVKALCSWVYTLVSPADIDQNNRD
jgi:Haem-binding domain